MKPKLPAIRTRLDKNRKGETITRIVSSYRNKEGKSRQKHLLNWGKHPTIKLERLISKYNKAVQIGQNNEVGKTWTRILQLRKRLQVQRTVTRKWLGKKSLTDGTSPYSLFLKAVVSLKQEFEKVLEAQALEKVDKKELPRLQEFLDATQWFAELRTHIKQKVKRMMPQEAHNPVNPFSELVSKLASAESIIHELEKNKPMAAWSLDQLEKIRSTLQPTADTNAKVKRLLMEKSADQ